MFLEVKFHDNDFSQRFMCILVKLWKTIKVEKLSLDKKTIAEEFLDLYANGCLQPMIVSMVAAEATIRSILDAATASSNKYQTNEFYTKYFKDIELEFHKTNKFTEEWQNGEHYWLDLDSGDVGQF